MPQCSFIVKEEVGDFSSVKLLDYMESKVSLSASATPENPCILQKLGIGDPKRMIIFVVKNCSEIDWTFGFTFGWE